MERRGYVSGPWVTAMITLAVFCVAFLMHDILSLLEFYRQFKADYPAYVVGSLRCGLQVAVVLLALAATYRCRLVELARELGLARGFWQGLAVGSVAVAPMWLGFALTAPLNPEFSLAGTLYLAVWSPVQEEIVFRGYAFGQLHRRVGWRFWVAILVTAGAFGIGHIEAGSSAQEVAGLFVFTAVGGAFFAWLFVKWDGNLWLPIVVHSQMNMNWNVFDVGETAVAGWWPAALQLSVLALAIGVTLFRERSPSALFRARS